MREYMQASHQRLLHTAVARAAPKTTYFACSRVTGDVQVLHNVEQDVVPFFFQKHINKGQF